MHKKIVVASLIVMVGAAALYGQDETARSTIGQLESVVNEGQASRQQQLDLARAYVEVGRLYEASELAKKVLTADAANPEASAIRDEASEKLRELNRQKVLAAEARGKSDQATDEDRLALADAYFSAGDYRAASAMYGRVGEGSLTREARLRHARALSWTSQYDRSERIYSRLLAEESTPELELEYGRLLSWMGAGRASLVSLRKVHERDRTEASALALANAMAWSGDREGAIAVLDDYARANPNAAETQRLAAEMRTSPNLRLERLDKLIEGDPFNLALRVDRARLLYEAGRYGETLTTIAFVRDRSDEAQPELDELERQTKARREEELARLDERRRALGSASMTSSTGSDAADEMFGLAKAYTGLGANDQAIELYEDYLEVRPDDSQARVNYARVLGWDQRYDAAERQYEILLRESPDRADLRFEHAQILSYNRQFVPALNEFRTLTDLSDNPRSNLYTDVPPKAYYNLGRIYRWFGWNDHAVEYQTRALELDSTYSPARQELTLSRYRRPATLLGGTYAYSEDSTGFQFRRIDFDGQKWLSPRTAVEGSVGRHFFERSSDDAAATAVSGGVRHRFQDRLMGRARLGANFYDEGLGTRPFWALGADWLPSIQSRLSVEYNHYDLIYDAFSFGTITPESPVPTVRDPLDIDDFRGTFDYKTGGFWSFLGSAAHGMISDDNNRDSLYGLLSFRVFKSPFIALKGEGRYLSFDRRTSRYWSPTDYRSYAAVVAIGQDVREKVYWTLEGKLGKSFERIESTGDRRSSDLRSFIATVSVPVSDAFDIVGRYAYGKSGRFDDVFGRDNDLTNYWQRSWYVGVRLKRLFASDDERRDDERYYYDNRVLSGSQLVPTSGENR